jgi:RNA polymerase sigma-70 factor, ECF subfamily
MHSTHASPFAATAHTAALPPPMLALDWADLMPHRSTLVAYARRRLMDPSLAEDLVHDVFEAVMTGRALYAGRAAVRSWLVGILKHKIVDLVRERSGHLSIDAHSDDSEEAGNELLRDLACPQPLPDHVAEQRQRLRQTLGRIASLPDTLRRTVEMRLLHDHSSEQVCAALQISEQNLFVRLHRARRMLAS